MKINIREVAMRIMKLAAIALALTMIKNGMANYPLRLKRERLMGVYHAVKGRSKTLVFQVFHDQEESSFQANIHWSAQSNATLLQAKSVDDLKAKINDYFAAVVKGELPKISFVSGEDILGIDTATPAGASNPIDNAGEEKAIAGEEKPIEVSGNEFGEFDTATKAGKQALREAAYDYLTNLAEQGETVFCAALNAKVGFNKAGAKKFKSLGGNPIKLKLAAAIKEIIRSGRCVAKNVESYDAQEREKGITYDTLNTEVVVEKQKYQVKTVLRHLADGREEEDLQVKNGMEAMLDDIGGSSGRLTKSDAASPDGARSYRVNKSLVPCITDNIYDFLDGVNDNQAALWDNALTDKVNAALSYANRSSLNYLDETKTAQVHLEESLEILQHNLQIHENEGKTEQAALEREHIASIEEALDVLKQNEALLDSTDGERYVLNLFVKYQDENGNWVELKDEEDGEDEAADNATPDGKEAVFEKIKEQLVDALAVIKAKGYQSFVNLDNEHWTNRLKLAIDGKDTLYLLTYQQDDEPFKFWIAVNPKLDEPLYRYYVGWHVYATNYSRNTLHEEEVKRLYKSWYKEDKATTIEEAFAAIEAFKAEHEEQIKERFFAKESPFMQALPQLVGSEKQIKWAESIRAKQIAELRRVRNGLIKDFTGEELQRNIMREVDEIIAETLSESEARFWIDSRDEDFDRNYVRKSLNEKRLQARKDSINAEKAQKEQDRIDRINRNQEIANLLNIDPSSAEATNAYKVLSGTNGFAKFMLDGEIKSFPSNKEGIEWLVRHGFMPEIAYYAREKNDDWSDFDKHWRIVDKDYYEFLSQNNENNDYPQAKLKIEYELNSQDKGFGKLGKTEFKYAQAFANQLNNKTTQEETPPMEDPQLAIDKAFLEKTIAGDVDFMSDEFEQQLTEIAERYDGRGGEIEALAMKAVDAFLAEMDKLSADIKDDDVE